MSIRGMIEAAALMAIGVLCSSGAARLQDKVPSRPIKKIASCVGCAVQKERQRGYEAGFRLYLDPRWGADVDVLGYSSSSTSGRCVEVAAHCLPLAPCTTAEFAMVRNSSLVSVWIRVGADFVPTPFFPKPDKDGWLEVRPGAWGMYRTKPRDVPCNDIYGYRRVDIRNQKNGKLVAKLEWSVRCTRCVDRSLGR